MKELGLQTIAVAAIDASDRLRQVDDALAQALAENIEQVGRLRQPIEVRTTKGGYALIAGAHRLEAVRRLGWSEVKAFVFDASLDEARLAEIDENLVRHELNPLDRATFLAERKAVYERLHPETKHGGKRRGDQVATMATWSFSADAASRIGLGERTIRRAVMIAEKLVPDVKAAIVGTRLAQSQGELETLAKATPAEQREVVRLLFSDGPPAKTVSGLLRFARGGTAVEKNPDDAAFERLVEVYGRASAKVKRAFLERLRDDGDVAKYLGAGDAALEREVA